MEIARLLQTDPDRAQSGSSSMLLYNFSNSMRELEQSPLFRKPTALNNATDKLLTCSQSQEVDITDEEVDSSITQTRLPNLSSNESIEYNNGKRKILDHDLHSETLSTSSNEYNEIIDDTKYKKTSNIYPKRRGKWLPEEEEFTIAMIDCFLDGVLPLIGGTTLRSYLANQLNCDPMRVTKKLSTHECAGRKVDKRIGKRTFNPRKGAELEMDKKMGMLAMMSERFWKAVGENPPSPLNMNRCKKIDINDYNEIYSPMKDMKSSTKRRKKNTMEMYRDSFHSPSSATSLSSSSSTSTTSSSSSHQQSQFRYQRHHFQQPFVNNMKQLDGQTVCLQEDIESANLLLDLLHRPFSKEPVLLAETA